MKIDDLSRRHFIAQLAALSQSGNLSGHSASPPAHRMQSLAATASIMGIKDCLWSYRVPKSEWGYEISPPVFNIGGQQITAALASCEASATPARLVNGTTEYRYRGAILGQPDLSLEMQFRIADDNPIIRFRYALKSATPHKLTKLLGVDDLTYLGVSLTTLPKLTEVRLSNFVELWHSYAAEQVELQSRELEQTCGAMGPIIVGTDGIHSMVMAYEHGSQYPDAFLRFRISPNRALTLRAVKSNYVSGQVIDKDHHFETVWFETGAVAGDEATLAAAFRSFVGKRMTLNRASREPKIYYNTWNFQERNKWWNGRQYLDSMNDDRILSEIETAHRMGVEVFVLDAGWYARTGDWDVSRERFPHGLTRIKSRLDELGMKLGLWFGATLAAAGSKAYADNRDCVMSWTGEERKPQAGWEAEESYPMCLVSRYGDVFLGHLLRLAKEVGVTCFKWDGIEQYACDSPHHDHGGSSHSAKERADSHAFQLVQRMTRIADQLAETCPEAVVDFDITERGRAVGLAFLASGRYFLINNGPYYHSYDVPNHRDNSNWNLFFYKGAARTWICRSPLGFDSWIPSSLFLTHYFPDDPEASQEVNLASLVLGQNGIWGDLPSVSATGIEYISQVMERYKSVRRDVMESSPVATGLVGGSPEIHEKVSSAGRGIVVIFASAAGRYSYVTRNRVVAPFWASDGAKVSFNAAHQAAVTVDFAKPGAKMLFFGTE